MKKILVALCTFFALQNIALSAQLDWSDIEAYNQYKLSQTITFPGIAEFSVNQKFVTLDIITVDSNLIYYQMHLLDCQNPDLVADMILINPNPEDRSRDHSVGVQLEEGCNLGIWIEPADYFGASFFSAQ